jgi:hypothetical protein
MVSLVAWVGVCAALISGIEITLEHFGFLAEHFGFLADKPVDASDLPPPSLPNR